MGWWPKPTYEIMIIFHDKTDAIYTGHNHWKSEMVKQLWLNIFKDRIIKSLYVYEFD